MPRAEGSEFLDWSDAQMGEQDEDRMAGNALRKLRSVLADGAELPEERTE